MEKEFTESDMIGLAKQILRKQPRTIPLIGRFGIAILKS